MMVCYHRHAHEIKESFQFLEDCKHLETEQVYDNLNFLMADFLHQTPSQRWNASSCRTKWRIIWRYLKSFGTA